MKLRGEFLPERQFLLDNRSHQGKPGYEVLTPFRTNDGARLLVNRRSLRNRDKAGIIHQIRDMLASAAPTICHD